MVDDADAPLLVQDRIEVTGVRWGLDGLDCDLLAHPHAYRNSIFLANICAKGR